MNVFDQIALEENSEMENQDTTTPPPHIDESSIDESYSEVAKNDAEQDSYLDQLGEGIQSLSETEQMVENAEEATKESNGELSDAALEALNASVARLCSRFRVSYERVLPAKESMGQVLGNREQVTKLAIEDWKEIFRVIGAKIDSSYMFIFSRLSYFIRGLMTNVAKWRSVFQQLKDKYKTGKYQFVAVDDGVVTNNLSRKGQCNAKTALQYMEDAIGILDASKNASSKIQTFIDSAIKEPKNNTHDAGLVHLEKASQEMREKLNTVVPKNYYYAGERKLLIVGSTLKNNFGQIARFESEGNGSSNAVPLTQKDCLKLADVGIKLCNKASEYERYVKEIEKFPSIIGTHFSKHVQVVNGLLALFGVGKVSWHIRSFFYTIGYAVAKIIREGLSNAVKVAKAVIKYMNKSTT